MKYQFVNQQNTVLVKINDDGVIPLSCSIENPEYLAWVAEGNTPDPYIAPEPTVPQSVSMRQARLALHGAGFLTAVDTAINAQDEPLKTQMRIEWDYAATVDRQWPTLLGLMPALGLTSAQVDALFIQAAAL